MNTKQIKTFARTLADKLLAIEDLKLEIKAISEAAGNEGISAKILAKVAKEMIEDSSKLRRRIEDEHQHDLFRDAVGILSRKSLLEEVSE